MTLPELALRMKYETVALSQTDQVLGVTGAKGDILERLIVQVTTAATSTVSIKDGSGSAMIVVAPNTPLGTYTLTFGIPSLAGAWKVTTLAGATVFAIGQFS